MRMSAEQTFGGHMQGDEPSVSSPEKRSESVTQPLSSSDGSVTSTVDEMNVIAFGPILVKQRKKPAPTLATGRRSRYEPLTAEEDEKTRNKTCTKSCSSRTCTF